MQNQFSILFFLVGLAILISLMMVLRSSPDVGEFGFSVQTKHESLLETCKFLVRNDDTFQNFECTNLQIDEDVIRQSLFSELPMLSQFIDEHPTPLPLSSPSSFLGVDDGLLIGFDSGEWGGGLFWMNEEMTEWYPIFFGKCNEDGNFHSISHLLKWRGEIIAFGGSSMEWLGGYMFMLRKEESYNSQWRIETEQYLPTKPRNVLPMNTRLFIEDYNSTNVIEILSLPFSEYHPDLKRRSVSRNCEV